MTCIRSIWCNPFVSMTLIAGSVAVTGCADAPQPAPTESAESTLDPTVISDGDALSGVALQSVQYRSAAKGDKVSVSGPAWTQTAPGEWTSSAQGTTTTIKVAPVANDLAAPPPPVTCNLNFYIGPSSPVIGVIGEAAIGQADCVDGSVAFTITAEVCTDLVGCVAQSASGVASPGLPFTFGIAAPGTLGASCLGEVIWVPPGAAVTGVNLCG